MKNTSITFSQRSVAERNRAKLQTALEQSPELDEVLTLRPRAGWDKSIPIILTYGSKGSHRQLRPRTIGDELASRALPKEKTPSTEAIRMANALMLERILGTGIFDSPAAFAKKIGISRKLMSDLLAMLNNPPSEIERIIFSTRE